MTTLAQVRKQIEQLEKHAAALLNAERAKAIAAIQRTMTEFSLTLADLAAGLGRGGKLSNAAKPKTAVKTKASITAKYRDPKTGKTWSGRGKPPLWIGKGNRDKFLIQPESTAVKAERSTPSTKTPATKIVTAPRKAKAALKKSPVAAKPKTAANKTTPATKKAVTAPKSPVKKATPAKAVKKPAPKKPAPKSTPTAVTPDAAPAATSSS